MTHSVHRQHSIQLPHSLNSRDAPYPSRPARSSHWAKCHLGDKCNLHEDEVSVCVHVVSLALNPIRRHKKCVLDVSYDSSLER